MQDRRRSETMKRPPPFLSDTALRAAAGPL